MTGSSASALIGLMFVVITLSKNAGTSRSREGTSIFSTPTVVHFVVALLVSATLNAPWPSLVYPSVILGITGLYGTIYVLRVATRLNSLESYTADAEDWTFHTFLPAVAYGAIFAGAILLSIFPVPALFAIAAAVVVMLFIGIHNAWDIVTFLAVRDSNP